MHTAYKLIFGNARSVSNKEIMAAVGMFHTAKLLASR